MREIELTKIQGNPYYLYAMLDGKNLAAFSSVFVRNKGKAIDHRGGLTAVGRNYRGEGLAKYLKANMYLKMLELYTDFEYIITDTYPWNKYMYRINEDMGFRPHKKICKFRFSKEFLKNFCDTSVVNSQ